MSKPITNKDDQPKDVAAAFRANPEKIDKLKAIAYWERKDNKQVFDEAITEYIAKYEKKHGEVKPVPTK